MSGPTDILVIDDEQVVLRAVRKVCRADGLSIDEAASAEAGLDRLATTRYGVVLSDLVLPGGSGLDVLHAVRRSSPDTPVVMITGFATWERTATCFADGAFDVLPKPFDIGELLAVVRRGLGFGRLGGALRASVGLDRFAEALPPTAQPRALYAMGQHAWVSLGSNGTVRLGAGESFGSLDDRLEHVELPESGEETLQGNRCARITTTEGLVHRVWAPLSGTIVEVNEEWKRGRVPGGALPHRWLLGAIPSDLENELPKLDRR